MEVEGRLSLRTEKLLIAKLKAMAKRERKAYQTMIRDELWQWVKTYEKKHGELEVEE